MTPSYTDTATATGSHTYGVAVSYADGTVSPVVEVTTGTTGTNGVSISTGNVTEVWYTLDGKRLSGSPTVPGVYIVNGKKIAVR